MVDHQAVPVGILERRAVANAGVERLALDLAARRLEPRPSLCEVGDAEHDRRERQRLERQTDLGWRYKGERHVAGLELDPRVGGVRVLLQPERLAVELLRSFSVLRRNRDEVDALRVDSDQPTDPSICSW